MKNVCVLTPSYDGKVTVSYMSSMMDYVLNGDAGIECVVFSNDSLITRIRNELFTDFYENIKRNGYTHAMWQDADVYMSAKGLSKILSYNLDVIGPAVPLRNEKSQYGVSCAVTGVYEKINSFLYKTRYLGTGLMLLSNAAVIDLVEYCEQNDQWYFDPVKKRKIYDIFQVGVNENKIYQSEDWYLCDLLKKIGYEVYVDSSSEVKHMSYIRPKMEINPEAIGKKFLKPLKEEERSLFWTSNDWLDTSISI